VEFLQLTRDYLDPAKLPVEVVERKGVGHPDSLADALANEVSVVYSRYCLEHFGLILHHNVDKLYVGAGHYKNDYGVCSRLTPVQVRVNGRMSSLFGDRLINLEALQRDAVERYLLRVLPRMTPEDLVVCSNATQNTKVPYWFTPRSRFDVPDADRVRANDTAFCVGHWPPTISESLAYRLERYFWMPEKGVAVPRFPEIGQDIKVMVLRQADAVEVTLCVPTMSEHTRSRADYVSLIQLHENRLSELATLLAEAHRLKVNVRVNPYQHQYMLGLGSCVECGEEGLVGRGNAISGVISSHRVHTQESWAGKNPVYHTGRVLSYLTAKLARSLGDGLQVKCTVSTLTRCGDSLVPPRVLQIATDKGVSRKEVERIIEKDFLECNYVEEILAMRPWMTEL
jgi:S-adenosylmethionine synthetase